MNASVAPQDSMNSDDTVVMVFGTFDGLHPGHLNLFEQARKHGTRLIAVIGRDATVMKAKGRAPVQNENQRLEAVKRTGLVDEVRLGHESDYYKVIRDVQPDVICLGYDQTHFTNKLPSLFPRIKLVTLEPFHPEEYKSSKLRNE